MNALHAEFRKLFTTQVWFWLLVGNLALAAFAAIVVGATTGNQLDYMRNVPVIFGAGSASNVFVMILGIIGITAEFRHQTITPTVLTTPSRAEVVAAKVIGYLLLGAAYALAGLLLCMLIALPWLNAKGIDVGTTGGGVSRYLLGSVLIGALFAVFGVGFGALVKNQAAAISVSLVLMTIVSGMIAAIPHVRAIYPYSPGGAAAAITASEADRYQTDPTLLPPAGGIAVLVAWGVALAACGAYRMNRDIS
jgi:ABC-type transport system involved in multi-copper enzyme maturation permease subunit